MLFHFYYKLKFVFGFKTIAKMWKVFFLFVFLNTIIKFLNKNETALKYVLKLKKKSKSKSDEFLVTFS